MSWGEWGKKLSIQEMISLLEKFVSFGITSFDHADIYGGYTTESAFGKAFTESNVQRHQIQLISKCGIQYVTKNRNNSVKHYNYSKEYIIWSAEQSLKNLQTDYIDLFLLHRPSPLMQANEIAEAVMNLKQSGKIKAFGVSNFTASQMDLLRTALPIQVNQIEVSLTHHQPLFDGTLDYLYANETLPMAWSPLGSFFNEESEQNNRIKAVTNKLSRKYDATNAQLLIAWLLKHPARIVPVVGTTNPARIQNALAAYNIKMETEEWFELLVASQGHKVP